MAPLSSFDVTPSLIVSNAERSCNTEILRRKPRTATTKKSVSFHPQVRLQRTMPLRKYTQYEVESCWYSMDDLKVIKQDTRISRNLFENGTLQADNEEYCRRAASLSERMRRERRTTKRFAIEAVLCEQEDQRVDGEFNPDAIARSYSWATAKPRAKARAMGLRDQLDAM